MNPIVLVIYTDFSTIAGHVKNPGLCSFTRPYMYALLVSHYRRIDSRRGGNHSLTYHSMIHR